jgi:hypothetical protein
MLEFQEFDFLGDKLSNLILNHIKFLGKNPKLLGFSHILPPV